MSWAVRGEREGGEEVFASQTFHQSSHISDLLPRCAPQLSSPIIKIIPPCHHHPHPRYDWITSFLSKTLTCCLWAKGWGWNSMLFFSVHFFISLFVVEFTALWSFKMFVFFFIFEVLVCLFLEIIFLGPPFPDRAHLSRTTRQTSANWNLVKWSLGAWECRI